MAELTIHPIETVHNNRYFYQYVLTDERTMLVDTGFNAWVGERIDPQLSRLGLGVEQIDYVLNTHSDIDHYGGNGEIRRKAPNAVLMAHSDDALRIECWDRIRSERFGAYEPHGLGYGADVMKEWRWLAGPDTPLDIHLTGDEVIRLGQGLVVSLVRLPGHSPGLLGVWHAESKTLVANDGVLWRGMVNVGGVLEGPPPYFDVEAYRRSICTIMAMGPEHLYLGHYPAKHGPDVGTFLRESLDFTFEMEQAVKACFETGRGAVTVADVVLAVNDACGPYSVMVNELAAPVYAHLVQLEHSGWLERLTETERPSWQRT